MTYEKFTNRSRKVLQLANSYAHKINSEYINSELILIGLIQERYGLGGSALIYAGVTIEAIEEKMKSLQLSYDQPKFLWPKAIAIAGKSPVGTEHILLAMLDSPECNACKILSELGLLETTKEKLNNILQTGECFATTSISLNEWGKLTEEERKQALIDLHKTPAKEFAKLLQARVKEYEQKYEMDTATLLRRVKEDRILDWDTIGHWMMLAKVVEKADV